MRARPARALALALLGACCAGDRLVSERLSTLWAVNGPRLRRYVEADRTLTADPAVRGDLLTKVAEMDRASNSGPPFAATSLWAPLGARLRAYIGADAALDVDSRRIRLESVDRMDAAVREAKGGAP